MAIKNLSLKFNTGEVFGLLGPNGAGKTTAMSIVTSNVMADTGAVTIFGESINLSNMKSFYDHVAYCPQHNPLWEELTLREHLELYAILKGIPKDDVTDECNE
jgi:ABC-type multidrug transport system ATPase subunit